MLQHNYKSLEISTPEGICFSMPLANPMVRLFAITIDFFMVMVLFQILSNLLLPINVISSGIGNALLMILQFVFHFGYSIFLEWTWNGQTIGKKLFRLKVMDAQGLNLQFNQVFMRNILRVVDSLPLFYAVGGIFSLFTPMSQRLGDIAANTVVIRVPKPFIPDIDKLGERKFNSFKKYPHLCARLRQLVSPVEANIAFDAILRKNSFDDDARIELYDTLAKHFMGLVDFPDEATLGLTSEHIICNVLETIT